MGLTAAVILAVLVFAVQPPPEQPDLMPDILLPDAAVKNIAVNSIAEPPAITDAPAVGPDVIPTTAPPAESVTANEIPLTVIEDKPGPPAPPDTAYTGEQAGDAGLSDVAAHEALEPALKNPDVTPDIPTATAATSPPTKPPPKNGSVNAEGEVYVQGFGWVKSGGDNIGEKSGSDGDWNKQIGNMG